MLGAYVIRLVLEARANGEVVGEVQEVDTGRRRPVRSADELIAALLEAPSTREGE